MGFGAAAELWHVLCSAPATEGLTGDAVCGVTTRTASKPCKFNESEHTSHIPEQSSWNLKHILQASFPKKHMHREGIVLVMHTKKTLI